MRRFRRAGRRGETRLLSCKFVRELTEIDVPANTDTVVANSVTLNANTLTAGQRDRWEQYRIKKVKFTYVPSFNVGATLATNQDGGSIFTVVDTRGTAPVMSANRALNYYNAKRRNFYKPFSMYYSPSIVNVTVPSDGGAIAAFTDFRTIRSPARWLDCDTGGDIVHYGNQVLFNHVGPNILKWGVIETLYVQFRYRNGH